MPTKLRPEHAQKAYELLTAWVATNHPDKPVTTDRINSKQFPGLNLRAELEAKGIQFAPFHDHEVIGAWYEQARIGCVGDAVESKRIEVIDVARLREFSHS